MIRTPIAVVAIIVASLTGALSVTAFVHAHPLAVPAGATPPVCVEALDYAQEGFANNADAMDAARRAVAAASRGDREGVADATDDLDAANDRVEGIVDDAAHAAHACRAGAR